jgi:hypothetical protein
LADELERIGIEGHESMLAQFAVASRVASHQIAGIIGGAAGRGSGTETPDLERYGGRRTKAAVRPPSRLVGRMIGPWTGR